MLTLRSDWFVARTRSVCPLALTIEYDFDSPIVSHAVVCTVRVTLPSTGIEGMVDEMVGTPSMKDDGKLDGQTAPFEGMQVVFVIFPAEVSPTCQFALVATAGPRFSTVTV